MKAKPGWLLIISLLTLTVSVHSQQQIAGLYGDCKGSFSRYACQQILLNKNSTFVFYDLLHLRGWTLSYGTWHQNGDTIILDSSEDSLYQIKYVGKAMGDSITIRLLYAEDNPVSYAGISMDGRRERTNEDGLLICDRKFADTLVISAIGAYTGPVIPDKARLTRAAGLDIYVKWRSSGELNFRNEKWLVKHNKLFPPTEKSTFDKSRFLPKVKRSALRYRPDY